jgi:hypothetical protein
MGRRHIVAAKEHIGTRKKRGQDKRANKSSPDSEGGQTSLTIQSNESNY